MPANNSKEFIVNYRDTQKNSFSSKTVKADTASAAVKIIKGICKAAQILSTRQR